MFVFSDSIDVTGTEGTPPVADLSISPSSGQGFIHAQLNASASQAPDSQIMQYEFDLGKGDGWVDYGLQSVVHQLYTVGSYTVKVRVRNHRGQVDEDTDERQRDQPRPQTDSHIQK